MRANERGEALAEEMEERLKGPLFWTNAERAGSEGQKLLQRDPTTLERFRRSLEGVPQR